MSDEYSFAEIRTQLESVLIQMIQKAKDEDVFDKEFSNEAFTLYESLFDILRSCVDIEVQEQMDTQFREFKEKVMMDESEEPSESLRNLLQQTVGRVVRRTAVDTAGDFVLNFIRQLMRDENTALNTNNHELAQQLTEMRVALTQFAERNFGDPRFSNNQFTD